jgi:hypothetical protein
MQRVCCFVFRVADDCGLLLALGFGTRGSGNIGQLICKIECPHVSASHQTRKAIMKYPCPLLILPIHTKAAKSFAL